MTNIKTRLQVLEDRSRKTMPGAILFADKFDEHFDAVVALFKEKHPLVRTIIFTRNTPMTLEEQPAEFRRLVEEVKANAC